MNGCSPRQFAAMIGASPQAILTLCKAGMAGAVWDEQRRRWRIEPAAAKAWCSDPHNAPRISLRQPVALKPKPPDRLRKTPVNWAHSWTESNPVSPADAIGIYISMLQTIVNGLIATMRQGELDSRGVEIFKKLSSELRQMVELARREREADDSFILRETHQASLEALARLVVVEGDVMARALPECILMRFTEASIEFPDAKAALLLIGEAVKLEWDRCLQRVADFIEREGIHWWQSSAHEQAEAKRAARKVQRRRSRKRR